jgi:hypothetical protein
MAIGGFGARFVKWIAVEDGALAGPPLGGVEDEGAGADDLRHGGAGIECGQPLRHHDRDRAAGLAEGVDDEGERALQVQHEGLRVGDADVLRGVHQLGADRLAFGPAPDGGDAVLRGDRGAIAPDQAISQLERVGQPVVADLPALEHLRVVVAVAIDADEHVEDQIGEDPGGVDGGDDRVEYLQFRVQRHPQDAFIGAGGKRDRGDHGSGDGEQTGGATQCQKRSPK